VPFQLPHPRHPGRIYLLKLVLIGLPTVLTAGLMRELTECLKDAVERMGRSRRTIPGRQQRVLGTGPAKYLRGLD